MPAEYLSAAAQQVVKPGMTTVQQAQALQAQGLSHDAVKSLANGLPEKDAVKWAGASAEKVSNPANKPDMAAIQATKNWVNNPTPEAQKAAADAAAKTDFKTPGAWAAQSAAWAGTGGGLTQHAAGGAVLLAAAQGGKPIPAAGALNMPQAQAPAMEAPQIPTAQKPFFNLPFFKKPDVPEVPKVPEVPIKGPDGLSLTAAQRVEMSKNCDPFIKLGCDIGSGKA